MDLKERVREDLGKMIDEWVDSGFLHKDELFVLGCSTSEVAGKHIGTSGSEEIAAEIFSAMKDLQKRTGVRLAFQCCEHLNRAIVVERETMQTERYEEVSAIPVPTAGGSMAAYAYKNMDDPVVVEHIKAVAGMDIGETMIGMQLKHVAVPLRFQQKSIGDAHVSGARTRPKLIGGKRANYENTRLNNRCT